MMEKINLADEFPKDQEGRVVDTVEKARAYLELTEINIREIEYQLAERDHVLLSDEEYANWRYRANRALLHQQRFKVALEHFLRKNAPDDEIAELLSDVIDFMLKIGPAPGGAELLDRIERYLDRDLREATA